ncbi:dTDP-4-dehydrorhamnose reductase [Halobacteriovorax sp. JY17]|uniref:dTDP-4-dehydrorhamnose reductase n=1 Tax=Halobacteriovorax sp. JY17 TaxID=2014617 RepID=UPI0025C4951D|nr:dTDP-4-dehydrorhamnose reductase [Halobacteriovorax sp. JY17]
MIYIFGANGQLGQSIKKVIPRNIETRFLTSSDLDITDESSLQDFFKSCHKNDFIINCAAYTAVDNAEKEKDRAFLINAHAPKKIAQLCKENDINLIHISTDYIFDGISNTPIKEDQEPNPINTYGASKLEGERGILSSGCKYIIIRTSWVFSEFGSNFLKTMINLSDRDQLTVVSDQIGSPTYAPDLASAIIECIQDFDQCKNEVYHFSNSGKCSWFEFSKAIMESIDAKTKILPTPTSGYPTPAKRPAYSLLNVSKIESKGIRIRNWKEALASCIKELKND